MVKRKVSMLVPASLKVPAGIVSISAFTSSINCLNFTAFFLLVYCHDFPDTVTILPPGFRQSHICNIRYKKRMSLTSKSPPMLLVGVEDLSVLIIILIRVSIVFQDWIRVNLTGKFLRYPKRNYCLHALFVKSWLQINPLFISHIRRYITNNVSG